MTRTMTATPLSGERSVQVVLDDSVACARSGMEQKSSHTATILYEDVGVQTLRVIEKFISESGYNAERITPKDHVNYYGKMWRLYREAGMNVLPWMMDMGRSILMPDITADGSALYGKSAQLRLNKPDGQCIQLAKREPHPLDPYFLQLIQPEHFSKILEATRTGMIRANNAGIILPIDADAFELYMHPDDPLNTWELVTIDLALSYQDVPNDPNVIRTNKMQAASFLTDLTLIQAGLTLNQGETLDPELRSKTYDAMLELL